MKSEKFMQSLSERIYQELSTIANEKGIKVQELIRSQIIPDWLKKQKKEK